MDDLKENNASSQSGELALEEPTDLSKGRLSCEYVHSRTGITVPFYTPRLVMRISLAITVCLENTSRILITIERARTKPSFAKRRHFT